MKRMKRSVLYLVLACIVLGLAGAGDAYVLPAEQILNFMIDQFRSARTLVILQKTVVYDPSVEGGMQELDEALYYQFPDRFRREMSTEWGEQVRVVGPEGALFVTDGKIIAEREDSFDHFKDLFLYRKGGLLLNKLFQLGVNLDVVSLGRYKERIAYVIGANYPDESVPQVWIEKNTFRPIRYIPKGRSKGVNLEEIEYADYMPLDKKGWYPSRIFFYRDGELARMYVLKTFQINSKLPHELFDVGYLKTVYQPITSSQPQPLPTSGLDEVQKAINDFRKTFE
jgi:hypothetical protein